MPTRGPRVDYYPMIDITEEYPNSKETRKRKATFEDDDYASGDDTASISINNELTVGKKKTAGSIRDEPCLACVTRGIKTPGHECHNQNSKSTEPIFFAVLPNSLRLPFTQDRDYKYFS